MSLNIELLEQSFETVKAHNAEFSTNFYNTLLAEYPDVKPLFANANMKE
jgi:hemoglobin-like flavoprotein